MNLERDLKYLGEGRAEIINNVGGGGVVWGRGGAAAGADAATRSREGDSRVI